MTYQHGSVFLRFERGQMAVKIGDVRGHSEGLPGTAALKRLMNAKRSRDPPRHRSHVARGTGAAMQQHDIRPRLAIGAHSQSCLLRRVLSLHHGTGIFRVMISAWVGQKTW